MLRILAFLVFATQLAAQTATAPYYLVFLRRDPQRKTLSKEEGERIQAAHMANIGRMAKEGILVAAGPFEDEKPTISGIFVFKTDSLEAAKRIAGEDPTVVEHRNSVEVHAWHAPAGIGDEYFRIHKADPNAPPNMQKHTLMLLYKGYSEGRRSMGAHERYIEDLRARGKLAAAGRMDASDVLESAVVFRVMPPEEARRLMADDPAVKSGELRLEEHQWWVADHVLPW